MNWLEMCGSIFLVSVSVLLVVGTIYCASEIMHLFKTVTLLCEAVFKLEKKIFKK